MFKTRNPKIIMMLAIVHWRWLVKNPAGYKEDFLPARHWNNDCVLCADDSRKNNNCSTCLMKNHWEYQNHCNRTGSAFRYWDIAGTQRGRSFNAQRMVNLLESAYLEQWDKFII